MRKNRKGIFTMKIVYKFEKLNEVDLAPTDANPLPWVRIFDIPCGSLPVVEYEKDMTHWIKDGYVYRVWTKDVDNYRVWTKDVNSLSYSDSYVIPVCEISVVASEVKGENLSPMEFGCKMARKAHERMECYSYALAKTGCDYVSIFIRTRPFLMEKGKNIKEPIALIQFSMCGW